MLKVMIVKNDQKVLASSEKIVEEMDRENQQSNRLTLVHLPTAAVMEHLCVMHI